MMNNITIGPNSLDQHTPPLRHTPSDIIAAYAAGALDAPVALVIATHLEMCVDCLGDYEAALAIGGAMLRQLEVPASTYTEANYGQLAPSFDVMNELVMAEEAAWPENTPADIAATRTTNPITVNAKTQLPKVLQEFLIKTKGAAINLNGPIDESLATLPWQKRTKKLRFANFDLGTLQDNDNTLSESINSTIELEGSCNFIELQAGSSLPSHTHKGEEYLVVLTGSLQDEHGVYHPGDLVYADSGITHTPTAVETCICLAATTAPVKFTGIKGAVLNMLGLGRL